MKSKPDIFLWNALSKKKEKFESIKKGKVGMYHCGPTVYDFAHIGNLRAYVFADILRRTFEAAGYKVKQVINITDIGHLSSDADSGDDKMVKGLKREGLPMTLDGLQKLADKYEESFKQDLKLLNIETKGTKFPRASKHLKKEEDLIKKLQKKGLVYETSDGLYFDTGKINDYGKLGGLTPVNESEARISEDGKKNPRDFALWKFSKDGHMGFKSSFGLGYPGWHIECSAMSMEYLGKTFDIHTGGIDHIPVHHNNEIAQSEHATGKNFAHYWMHNAFVNIDSGLPAQAGKMAKSKDNFLTLSSLVEKGYDPLAYRYFLLSARYSAPINFTLEGLNGAANALNNLRRKIRSHREMLWDMKEKEDGVSINMEDIFKMIGEDLNTAELLAGLWKITEDYDPRNIKNNIQRMKFIDKILGLNLFKNKQPPFLIPKVIKELNDKRNIARKSGQMNEADKLREEIRKYDYEPQDLFKKDGVEQDSIVRPKF